MTAQRRIDALGGDEGRITDMATACAETAHTLEAGITRVGPDEARMLRIAVFALNVTARTLTAQPPAPEEIGRIETVVRTLGAASGEPISQPGRLRYRSSVVSDG